MLARLSLLAAACLATATGAAAQAPPAGRETLYVPGGDIQALVDKIKTEKPGAAAAATPMMRLAPYTANLEYRTARGAAAVHEANAEFMHIIEGSGVLVTGGKLVGERRTNADNLTGTAIEGGTSRTVKAGDFVFIPQGEPHWFSSIDGQLVMMSMNVPRAAPPTP